MSFFFALPPEGRPQSYRHAEDTLSVPKNALTQRSTRMTPDSSSTPAETVSNGGAAEASPDPLLPRKNIVFPDPVAFRYLEKDPSVTVVERQGSLRGYELYLVEQWACSRQSPTLVIVTYTGDEKHSVVVGVLSVPEDESLWSTKLRVYFKATRQYLARPKKTDLGELMVTNLSSFPSALTVIHVPDGDIRKHRQAFLVNENLKRLGCSGRSGLTLSEPAEGTQAKFQSLYKVFDRIPFQTAVIELVKLCQVALFMFVKLDPEYIDGLLCDVTEKAVGNWWTEVGAEHFNYEPSDGILGPTTVAALLGMLLGARNRLYWYGAPVGKDAFDIESTKRGIAYFQKSFKIDKTGRLDRPTLLKLHMVTAKAAAAEGWGVQKAVKSRMTEIGGKRGEIVMGMMSGKDKGGLADVETLDLDRFISFAYGERAKWLWYGKPRRTAVDQPSRESDSVNVSFGKDEANGSALHRPQTLPIEEDPEMRRREDLYHVYTDVPPGSSVSISEANVERDILRRNVLKSVAGKMGDAKSGLGRIKDAVGGTKRVNPTRNSISAREDFDSHLGVSSYPLDHAGVAHSPAIVGRGRAFTWKNKPDEYLSAMRRNDQNDSLPALPTDSRDQSSSTQDSKGGRKAAELEKELGIIGSEVRHDVLPTAPSTAGSLLDEADLEGPLLDAERKRRSPQHGLSRRHSLEVAQLTLKHVFNEDRWPRRMSFGDAEEAILTWNEIVDLTETVEGKREAQALAEFARHLNQSIDEIVFNVNPWVEEKLADVALLDERFARDKDDLQNLYHQLSEACQKVRYNSDELLAEERAGLTESVRQIDVLVARLEYEISGLVQKVADVEDGVQNFERHVDDLEKRAAELQTQLETESWVHWLVRSLTGVGTGPNITLAQS